MAHFQKLNLVWAYLKPSRANPESQKMGLGLRFLLILNRIWAVAHLNSEDRKRPFFDPANVFLLFSVIYENYIYTHTIRKKKKINQ